MKQSIVHVALVVRDYDEAIRFYSENHVRAPSES